MRNGNVETARRLHAEGLGYKRIARKLGISRDSVRMYINVQRRQHFERDACPSCGGQKTKTSALCRLCRHWGERDVVEERVAAMIEMRLAGKTNGEIGEHFGQSAHWVSVELYRAKGRGVTVPRSSYFLRGS